MGAPISIGCREETADQLHLKRSKWLQYCLSGTSLLAHCSPGEGLSAVGRPTLDAG